MKILLVDDETLDLFIAKTVLQAEFQVEAFTSIEDAVTWARRNSFDAALIDYYLGTDTHATDALRAIEQAIGQPVRNAFVLSNFVDAKQTSQLKAAGFEGVISKPISLEHVRARLAVAG